MTSQEPNGVHIDRIHAGAICEEIGEGLRATLTPNSNRLPPHLLGLTERFERAKASTGLTRDERLFQRIVRT
jgi:hypothetical protein